MALVAASKPGADLFKKAATRIEKAIERKQNINLEVDEDGNVIEDSDNESEDCSDVVYSESFSSRNHSKVVRKIVGFPCMV